MRKYNNKMKRTMIIIGILFVIIVIIFSLFLKKAMEVDRSVYEVSSGSIMFDKEYNMITINGSGTIRMRWGGDYYLDYNGESYNLGSHSVVYDSSSGDISLYGEYYEVFKDGEVEVIDGENKVKSSVNSKFYKLADRKYLIIDRVIESSDSDFATSNYLIVNLDKLGNATLLNDKTSYKTITPTVLKTSSFVFDIPNEILNFGDKDIDLKKIIGSTNLYDEDTYDLNANITEDEEGEDGSTLENGEGTGIGTGTGSGSGSGTGDGEGTGEGGIGGTGTGEGGTGTGGSGQDTVGGAGSGIGLGGEGNGVGSNANGTTAGSSSEVNNNYSPGVSDEVVQEIINATKNTSVIRVTGGIDNIEVDYVVYDPLNEYKSVYVEVENTVNSSVNVVYLAKSDTSIVIRDLTPNVYYNLVFKYTYYDDSGNLKEYTFDEVGLYTEIPKMVVGAVKISNNKLYYKISLDSNYTITGGTVNLYLNGQFTGISSSIGAVGSVSQIYGNDYYLDLSSLNLNKSSGDILEVRLVQLSFNTYTVSPSVGYKFKY